MELKIPQNQEERLKKLGKTERERIRKKLREIDKKIASQPLDLENLRFLTSQRL